MQDQYGELQLEKKRKLQRQLERHIKQSAKAGGWNDGARAGPARSSADPSLTLNSVKEPKNNSGQVD